MTRPSRPFVALLLLATGLLLYVAWPFRTPLFLAVVTLAVLVLIVAPFAALVGFVTREFASGLEYLRGTLGVTSVSELHGAQLPAPLQRILEMLHVSREQVFDLVTRVVEIVQDALPEIVASGSKAVLATAIMLIALYFLLLDGSRVVQWAWRVSPLDARQTEELTAEMRRVTRATVIGILATAVFQGLAAAGGYLFAGIPHAAFFGLLTAMVSFVPGVGTSLVWAPAAISLWIGNRPIAAVALGLYCLVVVVGAEQVGKPLLLRGQVQMHTGLIFLSLLGGLAMFGLLGILLGPLIVAFFLAMMRIYERDFRHSGAPPVASDRAA